MSQHQHFQNMHLSYFMHLSCLTGSKRQTKMEKKLQTLLCSDGTPRVHHVELLALFYHDTEERRYTLAQTCVQGLVTALGKNTRDMDLVTKLLEVLAEVPKVGC